MRSNNNLYFSRRNMMAGSFALSFVMAVPSFALSTATAQGFVEKAIGELQQLVNKGSNGASLQKDVTSFFRKYADVGYIGRAVIGAPWRGMSADQQKDYTSAFEGYVVRKYSAQLGELKGGQGQIIRSKDQGNSGIAVDCQFVWSGFEPTKMQFLIADVGGKSKVLDLKIKGVSLLSTERVLVRTAMTHRDNDIDKLIAYLKST